MRAETGAIPQCGSYPLAEMGVIDDEIAQARMHQCQDDALYHGLAAHRQQRFGQRVGKWSHALTPACRKYHGFHAWRPVAFILRQFAGVVQSWCAVVCRTDISLANHLAGLEGVAGRTA